MFRKFLADRRGNVATTFAVASLPLLAAMGAAVDFSRSYDERQTVQDALDSAVLAAGKKIGTVTEAKVKEEAQNFYQTNIAGKLKQPPAMTPEISGSTIVGTAQLHVPTYFLGLVGLSEIVFNVKATATLAVGTLEVAMVLDNSTSMDGTKISTLKTAATNLTTTLYNLGATSTKPDPVKVALVPFAASVNVGSSVTWVDKLGKGTYAGDAAKANGASTSLNPYTYFSTLKDSSGNAITWGGCVEERPAPYDISDDAPSTAATPTTDEKKTLFVPMFAPDEPDNWTCSTGSCSYSGSSSSNRRYNGAATGSPSYNNYLPDVGSGGTCGPATTMTKATPAVFTSASHGLTTGTEIAFQTTGALYTGLTAGTVYYVAAAPTTSTFLLTTASSATNLSSITKASPGVFTTSSNHGFAVGDAIVLRTTGTLPSPLVKDTTIYYIKTVPTTKTFTVSTTSGGSAVNTTTNGSGTHSYVKLIATTGSQSGTHTFTKTADWTCESGDASCAGTGLGRSEENALAGVNISTSAQCKYGTTTNKAAVSTITLGGMKAGPNYLCSTTAITPLTTTQATVTTAINNQAANGYTNITGGLMWGWRVLSPGEPFTTGRAYTDNENQKILVLMTDGANTYTMNSKFLKSAYNAWGYIGMNHLGTTSSNEDDVVEKMEGRMAAACTAIKAAKIKIYTVAFQITDATTLQLLEDCATKKSMAYQSSDNTALLAAFAAIGNDITLLRVSE